MRRLRLALGLALAFLAGYWTGLAMMARTCAERLVAPGWTLPGVQVPPGRAPRPDGRLWPEERCVCGHDGAEHDPDLGCAGVLVVDAYDPLGVAPCGCRRRRCPCPIDPPGASR